MLRAGIEDALKKRNPVRRGRLDGANKGDDLATQPKSSMKPYPAGAAQGKEKAVFSEINPPPPDIEPVGDQNAGSTLPDGDDDRVAFLASLPELEYGKCRKDEAKKLGVPVGMLDRLVKSEKGNGPGRCGIKFEEVAPWPQPVNGAELLDEIEAAVGRFVVCRESIRRAVPLWIAMSWFADIVETSPMAMIYAPEKACGKSTLLSLLARMVHRPLTASNISPSAVYRVIEAHHPCLLIDEVDTFMKDNEELRGIINSGHTRDSAFIIRNVGDDHEPTQFSTWGAKALAGIGKLQETLVSRSIVLSLRRKLPEEKIDRLRYAEPELFPNLKRKLARWANDNQEAVRDARPYLPPELGDRAQDNWEPLYAIAMAAGGTWPEKARKASLDINKHEDDASTGAELLADIREAFEGKDKISTKDLLELLFQDEEAPWATWNRGGNPLTPRQLAKRLKEYGIYSKNLWIGAGHVPKGYERTQFEEAWSRYIP